MPISILVLNGQEYDIKDAAARAVIADAYSTSATYAIGDYVWYEGTLYRCTTAISTAETWTMAHWAVAEEVKALVGDLSKADIMRQQKLLRYEDHGGDWINQPGAARPTYYKMGPMLKINGAVTATSGYTYGISRDEMVEGATASIINPGIKLLAGHVYAAKVRFLDGTFTNGSATAYWHEARLYTWDGTTLDNMLVGRWRVNQGETVNAAGLGVMSAVITPTVDMTAGFAWYDRGAGEYNNFRFIVDLEDVTYIRDIMSGQ